MTRDSGLRARLRKHRKMSAAVRPRDGGHEAGLEGERRALAALQRAFGPKGWRFHAQPLMPDPNRETGRYEVDIIGIPPNGIILIEVKFWRGRITITQDGQVKQAGRRASHLFELQEKRVRSFERLFRTMHQRSPPEVRAVLLLVHPGGKPDEALLARPDVRTLDDLERLPEVLASVPPMMDEDREAVDSMLKAFGTWDHAIHRGPSGSGLHRWGMVPEGAEGPAIEGVDLLDRERISDADFTLRTSWWRALFRPPSMSVMATFRDGSKHSVEIDPEQRIPWMQPGEGRIEDGLPLYELKRIVFGRSSREDPRRLAGFDQPNQSLLWEVKADESFGDPSTPDTETAPDQSTERGRRRKATGERWREVEVGQMYEGTVDGWHEKHGMFVEVLPKVNGLLPMRSMPPIGFENLQSVYRRGTGLPVIVRKADGPKRILLDFAEE